MFGVMIDISLSDAINQILCLKWWLIFLCQMQLIKTFVWSDDWYFFVRCNQSNPVFGVMIDISLSDAINQVVSLEWWLISLSKKQFIKSCVWSDDWYFFVRCNQSNPVFGVMIDIPLSDAINQVVCLEWWLISLCQNN